MIRQPESYKTAATRRIITPFLLTTTAAMFYQIAAMMIWSSAFIAAKFAETMLDPILLVQFRLLIVAVILLPIGIPMFRKLPKSAWKPLIWLSFLNYIAVLILQFKGLQYTSASSALTMLGLEPLLVVFIGHFFFDDKARRYHWICGVLAFIGVFTLILGGQHAGKGGEISLLGCAMVLSGGIVFSAILRPTQKFMRQIPASTYTTLSFIIAAPLCLPFTAVLTKSWHIAWSWPGILGMAYLSIGCSWLAYWLWNKGMDRVPANLTGLLITLEPVFGILMAVVLLREPISALSWLGIAIVISATVLASMMPRIYNHARK